MLFRSHLISFSVQPAAVKSLNMKIVMTGSIINLPSTGINNTQDFSWVLVGGGGLFPDA